MICDPKEYIYWYGFV